MPSWLRILLLGLSLALWSTAAGAQPVGVLMHGEPSEELIAHAAELAAALSAHGASVIDADGLRTLLRAEGYEPYLTAADWGEELRAASETALQDAAFGRFERVRATADAQLARAGRVLAWLGTQPEVSARLADLCLFGVRADLRVNAPEAARQRAADCLRTLPDMRPNPDAHPERVLTLLEAVREAPEHTAVLELRQREAVRGCELRVQGHAVEGATRRPPGEYVLSLACSTEGSLVRRVELAADGQRLEVATALLHDVTQRGGTLHLRAGSDPSAALEELSAFARVQAYVLVEAQPGAPVRLRYMEQTRSGAGVQVLMGLRGDVATTVEALLAEVAAASGEDDRTPQPPAAEPVASNASPAHARAPRVGWPLAGTAVALVGAAWGLYGGFQARDAELRDQDPQLPGTTQPDPAYLDELDARDRLGNWSMALSAAGAALALSAVPLLTKRPRARRIWPWVMGAVGAGLAAAGAYTLSRSGDLQTVAEGRTRRVPVVPLGSLLLSQGLALTLAPLLSETGQQPRQPRAQLGFSGSF